MIPKIIHWCWLSDAPIPASLQKCMDSWKMYLPDYEFIHWNFQRFPKGKSKWVDEAFANKKYAFAADYIRLYALYNYGGIYLDMDVEVLKSFNPFLSLKTMMCWQNAIGGLEVAAFGVEKGSKWVKECLDSYEKASFVKEDGSFEMTPLPQRIETELREHNYIFKDINSVEEANAECVDKVIPVFSCEYFSPKSYLTGKIKKTSKTVSIHHFAGSWLSPHKKSLVKRIKDIIWKKTGMADLQLKKRIFGDNGKKI